MKFNLGANSDIGNTRRLQEDYVNFKEFDNDIFAIIADGTGTSDDRIQPAVTIINSMINETPGEYEEKILKMKLEEKKEKKEEKKEIEESRKLFVQTKDKYLDDMLLDLLLNENGKNDKNIIEQSKLEYKKRRSRREKYYISAK